MSKQINSYCKQLHTFCKKFEAVAGGNPTKQILNVQETELERRFAKLIQSYEEFIEAEGDVPSLEQKVEDANSSYLAVKAVIQTMIEERTTRNQITTDVNSTGTTGSPQAQGIRLSTINIPIFEGGYSKWPPFRDLFCGMMHNLTPAQKLAHLHDRMKGEAYDIVARFDIIDANFELAWNALVERYENVRILVHQQMQKLFGMQTLQSESPKGLRAIQNNINDSLAIFKSHKINIGSWKSLMLY